MDDNKGLKEKEKNLIKVLNELGKKSTDLNFKQQSQLDEKQSKIDAMTKSNQDLLQKNEALNIENQEGK